MQMFLMSIAQTLLTVGNTMMVATENTTANTMGFFNKILGPIIAIMDEMLVPIMIIIGTAGSIYAIILGVNFAKAESADKREEAKKRMINAVIALVVTIILLILLKIFTANAGFIADWINSFGSKTVSA